jgi:NADH-quinone oxidoreductase subunit A
MLISLLLFTAIILLVYSKKEVEKSSSYECGFHPFEDTRQKFNVRFYLVSILFLIFDLEIIFLFPWLLTIRDNTQSFYVMLFFLIVLTIGFIYEWLKGALTWE